MSSEIVRESLIGRSLLKEPTAAEKAIQQRNEQVNDALFRLSLNALKDKGASSAVVSPFSIAMALATVNEGAQGNTSQQITDVAFGGVSKDEVTEWFKEKLNNMSKYRASPLAVASAIYLDKTLKLIEGYKESVKENFKSDLESVDFRGDPKAQKEVINEYVKKNTGGHITNLFNDDDIHVDTRIVAVNALYMKAKFYDPFEEEYTKDGAFHNEDGSNKQVPTMHGTKKGRFHETDDFVFGNFGFIDHGFDFFIAVPKKGVLSELKENFVSANHSFSLTQSSSMGLPYLHVALPKFNVEASYGLVEALKSLGISDLFTSNANLSGITDESIFVDKVIHKAILELDEKGVTAAAITAMGIALLSACLDRTERTINADRPFLYGVTHQGTPIFVGQYY
uniref:SERPIN domain-containing protein n=1 Tax=Steinernema glaseri TaxID=37863 RepID=A0A1I8AAD2_9BILA